MVGDELEAGLGGRREQVVEERRRLRLPGLGVPELLVQRPAEEPGFLLTRVEGPDRTQRYAVSSYATTRPAGARYGGV